MSRLEAIELASAPFEESCAQTTDPDYALKGKAECAAYRAQLARLVLAEGKTIPVSLRLFTKANTGHDYGHYYEVAARFPEDDAEASEIAYWLEDHQPARWDDLARSELGLELEETNR